MGNMKIAQNIQTEMSLEHRLERLALESNYLANVIDQFKSVIPSLGEKIKEVYQNFTVGDDTTSAEIAALEQNFKKLNAKLPHAVYLNVSQVLVVVPEGFKGNWLQYLTFLDSLSDQLFRDANQLLGGYNSVLASFISNKQDKISLQDHTDIYQRAKKQREKIVDQIKDFFPTSSVTSRTRLDSVVSRFSELKPIHDAINKIGKERKSHSLKDLSEAVKQSVGYLDIVINDVQTNGVVNVSGNAARNIAEGAYEIGKFVELIALYRNMLDQAIGTTNKLYGHLENIL